MVINSDDYSNVLLIGNGFDLAHELPTKYSDFLDFCKAVTEKDYSFLYPNGKCKFPRLKAMQKLDVANSITGVKDEVYRRHLEKIETNIKNNIWYLYYVKLYENDFMGENWIDFESEMSLVIQLLDTDENTLDKKFAAFLDKAWEKGENKISKKKLTCFKKVIRDTLTIHELSCDTFKLFRKRLFDDLQRLILALEIYLKHFVEEIQIDKSIKELEQKNFTNVISFNYTHTAQKKFTSANVTYIHGESKEDANIDTNNMVLGIDEYWKDDRRNTNTNYVVFKKFVQRIQKNTYLPFGEFLRVVVQKQIRKKNDYIHLHIFGHSLDVTDKDILGKLFLENNVKRISIYCYDKPTQAEYIANIIKIIGQDDLISKMEKDKIEFIVLN